MATPKIGLIGLGKWGKNLLRVFHEQGVLHSACDVDPRNLESLQSKYPSVHFSSNPHDLTHSETLDAVAIAAPASLHYELVKTALHQDKDVFVEKPLSLQVKQGEELVALAQQKDRILMVGHILQFHPAIQKLKSLISENRLGKLQYIYSNRLNMGRLRTEENILWSFAPHDISVIRSLVQEDPISVQASGGSYISEGISDTTVTCMEFSNGVKGHIFVSWLHPFKEQKLVVVGSDGMVVFDDTVLDKLRLYEHSIQWEQGKVPVAHKAESQVIEIEPGEPLTNEARAFVHSIGTRQAPVTDAKEGLQVLKILDAAERSIRARRPVTVEPEEPSVYVHPSSYVEETAQLGSGTKIWHFCHVFEEAQLGENCIVGQNVMIGKGVKIGRGCKIQNNVSLYTGVELEDGVFCGPSCVFTNVYNPRAEVERKNEFLTTRVGQGSTIGANATIRCGVTLGAYSLIGAGAVVLEDVPPHAVMVGNPAKQIGLACFCGEKSQGYDTPCPRCGKRIPLG